MFLLYSLNRPKKHVECFAKTLMQVYMKLTMTQRKTGVTVVEPSGRGLLPPKPVASVYLSFSLL